MTLSICVPTTGMVTAHFSLCLAELTSYLSKEQIPFRLHMKQGSDLCSLRYDLAIEARTIGSSQILWLDTDMAFPKTLYRELHKHCKDVVAATYAQKNNTGASVAFRQIGGQNVINVGPDKEQGLVKVDAVGMGAMLVNMDVFKTLPKPWFKFNWDPEYEFYNGEDIHFCEIATQYGYEIYVDLELSRQMSHIGLTDYNLKGANGFYGY